MSEEIRSRLIFFKKYLYVGFNFNTFWGNKTTGDVNETAIKLRDKVINKIKSL